MHIIVFLINQHNNDPCYRHPRRYYRHNCLHDHVVAISDFSVHLVIIITYHPHTNCRYQHYYQYRHPYQHQYCHHNNCYHCNHQYHRYHHTCYHY